MSETVNQEKATNDQSTETKTFTQDELNAIVNDRLGREKAKYSDYAELKAKASKLDEIEEANKTELQKANEKASAFEKELTALKKENEIRAIRAEVAKNTNIPADLLTADTKEACEEQAKQIAAFASSRNGYPALNDGGEVHATAKMTTGKAFADWLGQTV